MGINRMGFTVLWSAAGPKLMARDVNSCFNVCVNFVYFITACGVCLYALVVNLDAFVVIQVSLLLNGKAGGWHLLIRLPFCVWCCCRRYAGCLIA